MASTEELERRAVQMRDDVLFLMTAKLGGDNDLVVARCDEIAANPQRSGRALFQLVSVTCDAVMSVTQDPAAIAGALDDLEAHLNEQIARVVARHREVNG